MLRPEFRRAAGILVAATLALPLLASETPVGSSAARAAAPRPLIVDGDFEANKSGNQLRRREPDGGWYESRNRQGPKEARLMLKRSTKKIGRNGTRKAMLKGDPNYNTYLSQAFPAAVRGKLALEWDIYVREIMPPFNRTGFQMLGNAKVRGRGPNGSGAERFVFLGFENSDQPGRINLFAFEGKNPDEWDERTLLFSNLKLRTWHTIRVQLDVEGERYRVSVPGIFDDPVEVQAFRVKGKRPPDALTHISFATWNDGPGTFYVDNVRVLE